MDNMNKITKMSGVVNLKLNDGVGTWVQVSNPKFYMENKKKYFIGYQSDPFGFQKEVMYELHPSKNNTKFPIKEMPNMEIPNLEDIFF